MTIDQPKNKTFVTKNSRMSLSWHPNFAPKWTRQYSAAQRFVDSEILRLSEPFTPLLTGTLIKTGLLGTDIGSGVVQWVAPYSRSQYYKGRSPGTSNFGPLRGAFWFERGKQVWGDKVIRGAKKIAGRG